MPYMIALDGGGTKTVTVLFDESGRILHKSRVPGSNALDIGLEPARERILSVLREAARLAPETPEAVYCGAAGTSYDGAFFKEDMRTVLPCRQFWLEGDARNMIRSELYHGEDGCGLVVGTGCGCWVLRKQQGLFYHVGGWGYLVDTLGSGYSLGREAVRAVCLAYDGRGPATLLSALLEQETGRRLEPSIPYLYAGGRARFASLAHLVFEGAAAGDAVCAGILEEGSTRLAELVQTADRAFDAPYTVVMGGGIVTAYPHYAQMIREKCPSRAELRLATAPPVFGAAAVAMHMAGLEVTADFRARFLQELRREG